MTVYELNRAQLDELKETLVFEWANADHRSPSWMEIADADKIPDETVFQHFGGYDFSTDDFFCTAGMEV